MPPSPPALAPGLQRRGSLLVCGWVLQGRLLQLQQPAHSNEDATTRSGSNPVGASAGTLDPGNRLGTPVCSERETPGLFPPPDVSTFPRKNGVALAPSCSPFPGVSISGLREGAQPAGDPAAQAPLAPAQRWGGPHSALLEEELGQASRS